MRLSRLYIPLLLLASCGKQTGDSVQQQIQYKGRLLTIADLKLPPRDNDFPFGNGIVDGHIFQSIREAVPEQLAADYQQDLMKDYRAEIKNGKMTFAEWYINNGRSDTAYYDTLGHMFAERSNGRLMPTSHMYVYDSLGFLRYSAFFSCTTSGQIHSYHFDPVKRTLCIDVMDSRTPAVFGKFYNQVPATYKYRDYTVFFFDTAGCAVRQIDFRSNAESGYIRITAFTYTVNGNPDVVSKAIYRVPASEDFKAPGFLRSNIDRSTVKYYYHGNVLDSSVMNCVLTGGGHSNLIQTTYFSEGLPRRMVEKYTSDYSSDSRIYIWKYVRYDSANKKRYEFLINNRNELLPKGILRMGY